MYPLRVGLMLDGVLQPTWVGTLIESIHKTPAAELAFVVFNEQAPASQDGFLPGFMSGRGRLLYAMYSRIDNRLHGRPDDALHPRNLTKDLDGVPSLRVTPRQSGSFDYVPDDDVEVIVKADLDVIVRIGFRTLRGGILFAARHGIWSFRYGDHGADRESPPGYWEIADNQPVTSTALERVNAESGDSQVLYCSWTRTIPWSLRRSQNNFYTRSALFVVRVLERIYREGTGFLEAPTKTDDTAQGNQVAVLTDRHAWRFARDMTGRYLSHALRKFSVREQWEIWFDFSDAPNPPLKRFTRIQPPLDRFWADPFPVVRDGQVFLFLEDFRYSGAKGHIAVTKVHRDGTFDEPKCVVKRPYHLSYPHVFEWDGNWWMIPETKSNQTVELYRCETWPDHWKLDRVLLAGLTAVDCTLEEISGRWWMFFSVAPTPGTDELHLFSASSPLGPWIPHPRNPVVSDVRSARPGGRLFLSGGCWVRPSQDGGRRYGGAIVLNRIDQLSPTAYKETTIDRIDPEWSEGLIGTHTLNIVEGFTTVDGLRRRRKLGG